MAVTMVNAETFDAEVLNADKKVLVDFYADWCGPCKMMGPVLDEISEEEADLVKIVKLNVDDSPTVAQKFRVMSIPNMIIFENGEELTRFVGVTPKESIVKALKA